MSKVYITNKGVHDFRLAAKYGELVYLSNGKFNLFSIGRIFRTFEPILEKSSEDDYLVISGATIMCVIAGIILSTLHGKVNLLLFSASDTGHEAYHKRTIILHNAQSCANKK
jgi:hypothetical protein